MFEQNNGIVGSLVWLHHVSSQQSDPSKSASIHVTDKVTFYSHTYLSSLCSLSVCREQKYPTTWMWSWHHQPQLHTGRWVTEGLPVCFIAASLGPFNSGQESTDYFYLFCLFFFFIYAPTASLWLFGVKHTHFKSALLSYFPLRHMVTNIARCWAPSRSGLQHGTPERISLVAVEDLRVGL